MPVRVYDRDPVKRQRSRILVVDDDAALRSTLAEGLSSQGYEVFGAADGFEAFDLLSRIESPDAIVLDLLMPGMHGWEFIDELRDDCELEHIPVIVLTGSADARVGDADAFLVKPATLPELVRALHDELGDELSDPPLAQ